MISKHSSAQYQRSSKHQIATDSEVVGHQPLKHLITATQPTSTFTLSALPSAHHRGRGPGATPNLPDPAVTAPLSPAVHGRLCVGRAPAGERGAVPRRQGGGSSGRPWVMGGGRQRRSATGRCQPARESPRYPRPSLCTERRPDNAVCSTSENSAGGGPSAPTPNICARSQLDFRRLRGAGPVCAARGLPAAPPAGLRTGRNMGRQANLCRWSATALGLICYSHRKAEPNPPNPPQAARLAQLAIMLTHGPKSSRSAVVYTLQYDAAVVSGCQTKSETTQRIQNLHRQRR